MFQRLRETLFPLLLFSGTLLVAAALALLVYLSPSLTTPGERIADGTDHLHRLLLVFAHDKTVRRTAVASAVGLAITAFVFFRPGAMSGNKSRSRRPPPSTLAGA